MVKTLADMTPEARQACVGMWCDNLVSTAKEPAPVVLECVQGELCWVLHIDLHGERSCFSLGGVSPRFDLPRAWNPDGTPVALAEDVEHRIVDPDTNGGRYELRRWVRGVTEWRLDDE